MDPKTLYYLIATVMIVIGLLGAVLPALPGLPLVFGGMLVAAWADGFSNVPVWVLVLLGILTFSAVLVIVANLLTDLSYRWLDPRLRGK